MCYERWLRQRERAQESEELWRDFHGTRPVADPEVRDPQPAPTEAREQVPATREA